MEAAIQIEKLKKSYPGGIEALKGIDLKIGKGQLFALLGPNGAGKSTLVRIMTTLTRKDSGKILISDVDPGSRFSEIQQYIGAVSQENELDPSEKAENLLQFQARLFGMNKQEATQRTNELLELFQLSAERFKKVENLSGGNKRKLHCALALAHRPCILFLDEPTVGMDPMAREAFWNVISGLNRQECVTVLLTTQYLEEADKYASDMALIIEGQIHFSGLVSSFKEKVHPNENVSLEESYLKYVKSFSSNNHNTIDKEEKI